MLYYIRSNESPFVCHRLLLLPLGVGLLFLHKTLSYGLYLVRNSVVLAIYLLFLVSFLLYMSIIAVNEIEVIIKYPQKDKQVNRIINFLQSFDMQIKCAADNTERMINILDIYYIALLLFL